MSRLGKEEQAILEAFEGGKLKRLPDRINLIWTVTPIAR